ncbi:hypothetical protein F1C58_16800 (plasmid) [Glaciihabitans sp. INWT7]|uniref:hypothetical protein n=1 Tax=Glaciihabitans sp. INWT7 TaxID=2596912 RepID=UPI00162A7482|nr:hypothetical protein [Glaciihabitans sp. INWT7]QNE48717.1 hypothetical protein F1C58_16800 [Glaciihabitans sp. INWT7]
MIVGNLLLVAGGVSDNWPAHLSIRASARPAHMREATWVFVRSGRILLMATGAFASLPILALIEMFTVQILRVLLQR